MSIRLEQQHNKLEQKVEYSALKPQQSLHLKIHIFALTAQMNPELPY